MKSLQKAVISFFWFSLVSPFQLLNRPVRHYDRNKSLPAIQGAGLGVSDLESTREAVREAVSQALDGLAKTSSSSSYQSIMAFCSATVAHNIEVVATSFGEMLPPNTLFHGITSSGAILTPGKGSVSKAVACLLLSSSSSSDFATAFDARNGQAAAVSLKGKMPYPQAIFMGATPGAEEGILETLAQVFPGVPVFGGTAADNELNGNWMVWGGGVDHRAAVASGTGISLVGIGWGVKFGASMLGPYKPTSKMAVATKTDGKRRVFAIDGIPAVDWVYAWLGEEVREQYENGGLVLAQTAQKPIAVQTASGDYVTAHCAAFSGLTSTGRHTGETFVDFFAPIPQGSTLTVMDSGDGPLTGYAAALQEALEKAKSALVMSSSQAAVKAALLVYCGGMAIAVGDNLDLGLTSPGFTTQTQDFPVLGMTCFGEQASLPRSKTNVQRNLSVGMIMFG